MKVFSLVVTLTAVVCTSSCSDFIEGSDENMRTWFEWGTDLSLPSSAVFIGGKNNSLYLSDIYLKLQLSPEYEATLVEEFELMNEKSIFEVPDNMDGWEHWDVGSRDLNYYEKTTGSIEEGGFISQIAFESSTGIAFCHFVEYAP